MIALNERNGKTGRAPLNYGIGIHVGDVMYGNIGSHTRLDFTIIGPAVNMASRLEALTKQLGKTVLLSRVSPTSSKAISLSNASANIRCAASATQSSSLRITVECSSIAGAETAPIGAIHPPRFTDRTPLCVERKTHGLVRHQGHVRRV
jgi:hypothetical protein